MKLSQQLAMKFARTKIKLLSTISKKKAAEILFELFCSPQHRNKKALTPIFDKSEKLQFILDGITIRGWRWNNPSARKVLILHGFESTAVNYDKYIKAFIAKGYEVLAFDAPAHGRSEGKQINAPLYKKMILKIYKQFGPVQSFLAHSFGGLAISLAMEEMNHINDARLVLIAPATETTTAIDDFFNFLKADPALRPEFDKLIIKKSGVGPEWFSIRRAIRNIKADVLWIHDEDDPVTPLKDVQKVQSENHPHIRFVITKGLGHRRIYRNDKVLAQVIDFL